MPVCLTLASAKLSIIDVFAIFNLGQLYIGNGYREKVQRPEACLCGFYVEANFQRQGPVVQN